LRDTTAELAPVGIETALDMLHRLKCISLLTGFRGSKAVDLRPIAEAIRPRLGAHLRPASENCRDGHQSRDLRA
jgi:hypothetical protein